MTKGSKKNRRKGKGKGKENNHTHKNMNHKHKGKGNKKHNHKLDNAKYDVNLVVGDHNSVDNKHIVSKIGGMNTTPPSSPRTPSPSSFNRTMSLKKTPRETQGNEIRNVKGDVINVKGNKNAVRNNTTIIKTEHKEVQEMDTEPDTEYVEMDTEEEHFSPPNPPTQEAPEKMEVEDTSPIKNLTDYSLNEANRIVYQNEMHNFENLFFKNDLLFTNLLFEIDENDENDEKMDVVVGGDGKTPEPENIYTFMCYIYDRIHDFINGSRAKTIEEFISFTENEISLFEKYGSSLQENDNAYNIFNSIRMLLDDFKKQPDESSADSQREEEPLPKKARSNSSSFQEEETGENKTDIANNAASYYPDDDSLHTEILNFKERFVKLASIMIKNQIPKLQNYNKNQQGLNESNLVLGILDTKFYSFDCINSCKQEFILTYESDTMNEKITTEQNEIKKIINGLITELKDENIIYIKEEDKKDSTNNVLKRYVVYIFPKNKYIPPEFFDNVKSYYVTDVNIRASQQYYLYVQINKRIQYEELGNYDEYLDFCREIESEIDNLKNEKNLLTPLNGLDPVNGSSNKELFFEKYKSNQHLKRNVDNVMINALKDLQILLNDSYQIVRIIPDISNIKITPDDKSIKIELTINGSEYEYTFVDNFSTVDIVSQRVTQLNNRDNIDEEFSNEINFINFLLDTSLSEVEYNTKRDIIISMLYFFKYMGDRNPRKFSDDIYPNTTFITNDRPNISFKLLNYIIELIQNPIKINSFTGIISSINTNLILDADPIADSSADPQISLPTKSSTEYLTVIYIGSTTEIDHKKRYIENIKNSIKEMFGNESIIITEHLINEKILESSNFEFLNFVNFYKTYRNPNNTSLEQEIKKYLLSKSKISYSSIFKPEIFLESDNDRIYIGHLYTLYKTFLSLDISFVEKIDENFGLFKSRVLEILFKQYNETFNKIERIPFPLENSRASRHKDVIKIYRDDGGKEEEKEENKLRNMTDALQKEEKALQKEEEKLTKKKFKNNKKSSITEKINKVIKTIDNKVNSIMKKIEHYKRNIEKQGKKLAAIKEGKVYETKKIFKFPNAMEVKKYLRTRIDDLKGSFNLSTQAASSSSFTPLPPPQASSLTPLPQASSLTQAASSSLTQAASSSSSGGKHKKSRKRRTKLKNKNKNKNKKTKRKTKRKTKNISKRTKKQHNKNKNHKITRKKKQYKH
jgi:hypothetical protein